MSYFDAVSSLEENTNISILDSNNVENYFQQFAEMTTMIAVILAAGRGVRLRPLTYWIPKGLVRIGAKPLLRHSLGNLHQAGINEAIVVLGYKGEMVRQELGNICEGVSITYLKNPEYRETGSMYSLLRAEPEVDGDILLLESDLLYEPRAVDCAKQSPEPDLILVADARGSGDEVYIHADKECRLIDLGKQIGRKKAIGELVGISKLSQAFLRHMFTQAQLEIQKNRDVSYEEVIFTTAKKHAYPVYCVYIKGLLWTEIDSAHDLDEAIRLAGVIQGKG